MQFFWQTYCMLLTDSISSRYKRVILIRSSNLFLSSMFNRRHSGYLRQLTRSSLFLLIVCCQLTACINTQKLVYFQTLSGMPERVQQQPFNPPIQPGDLLSIQISSLNPEASLAFNPYALPNSTQPTTLSPSVPIPATPGYVVSPDSSITIPLIGKVKVVGKTTAMAADLITQKVLPFLKEPTVSVRSLNFRITVLGEVARPSMFTINNDRITLPEALGLAGDLTIYGRRDNVLLIREERGQRTYTRLDLTQSKVFQSPQYYLHPNDVIYVEPNKSRAATADRTNQLLPIVLSALSFVAIIVSRF
jgi:polysaccharide export outer membrane protein